MLKCHHLALPGLQSRLSANDGVRTRDIANHASARQPLQRAPDVRCGGPGDGHCRAGREVLKDLDDTPVGQPRARGRGLLDPIERLGNALPDPVLIFCWMIAALALVSVVAAGLGVAAQHPLTGEAIVAESLLSEANLRRLLAPGGAWLLYAHLNLDPAPADARGLAPADVAGLDAAWALEAREDGADQGRPSAWFTWRRRAA